MAKKIIAAVFALVMLLAFTGCNMAHVNTERDNAQVIIEVGDKTVTKGEMIDQCTTYVEMYASLYGTTLEGFKEAYPDTYDSMVQEAADYFIELALVDIYAEKLGADISLTDEQKAEVKESMQTNHDYYKDAVDKQVDEDDTISDDKKESEKERLLQEILDEYGYNDGSMEADLQRGYKIDNMKAWLSKDFEATDDLVREFYDEYLEEQKKVLDEAPGSISTYEDTDEISLYVPKGLRYMQVLYIPMSEDHIAAIGDADDDMVEELVEEALSAIKADADKALAAAKADFDAAIETYGDEATQDADDKVVRTYSGDNAYPIEVTEALFTLNKGEISDLIKTDEGYYIVKYTHDMEPGTIALSEVKEELKEKLIQDNMEDAYTEKLAEWKDEQKIVTYLDRL